MTPMLWIIAAAGLAALWLVLVRIRFRGADELGPDRPITAVHPDEVEHHLRAHLTAIANEQFPDHTGIDWAVRDMGRRPEFHLVIAEVEPRPDVVGYPRFLFGLSTAHGRPPRHVATWAYEDGRFTLLSTAREAPRGLPRSLASVRG